MKLIEIWERLGKQPLRVTQHKEAIVFVNGKEYIISNIKYDSGKFIGFKAKRKEEWFDLENKPKVNEWVVLKDKNGDDYDDYRWNGHEWYCYVRHDDGSCDGWRADMENMVSWRYQ